MMSSLTLNAASHDLIRNDEALIEDLVKWLAIELKFPSIISNKYAEILFNNGISTIARLHRKLCRNKHILLALSFDPDDADDIAAALLQNQPPFPLSPISKAVGTSNSPPFSHLGQETGKKKQGNNSMESFTEAFVDKQVLNSPFKSQSPQISPAKSPTKSKLTVYPSCEDFPENYPSSTSHFPDSKIHFTQMNTLQAHSSYVIDLCVLGHGLVASASYDNSIKVWQMESGHCENTLLGHTDNVYCLVLMADGRLASGSHDQTIRIWNVAKSLCEVAITGHAGIIVRLLRLRDGRLVSTSGDKDIRIWNITKTGYNCEAVLKGFSNNARGVMSGTGYTCDSTLKGHTASLRGVAELPNGKIVTSSDDKTIRIWDIKYKTQFGDPIAAHDGAIYDVIVLHDGRFATCSADRTIKIWSLSGNCTATLIGHTAQINRIRQLADGRIVSSARDNTIRIWDLSSSQCVATLYGHTDWVYRVVQLPDGRLVSASRDGTIRLWGIA